MKANQISEMAIDNKLFGPKNEVLVTRSQITDLASELYSTLNIDEDYEIPDSEFESGFIQMMIAQVFSQSFSYLHINNSLNMLSTYHMNFGLNIQPDVLNREMGRVFELKNSGDKQHITVNNEYLSSQEERGLTKTGVSTDIKFFGFQIGGAVSHAREQNSKNEWQQKSLKDQLFELNRKSDDEIQWEISATKVIPRAIKVARIEKSKLITGFTLNRVRKISYEAPFQRNFELYTNYFQEYVEPPSVTCESFMLLKNETANIKQSFENKFSLNQNQTMILQNNVGKSLW